MLIIMEVFHCYLNNFKKRVNNATSKQAASRREQNEEAETEDTTA